MKARLQTFLLIATCAMAADTDPVRLTENAADAGLPAYKIETPGATWFLEKEGAGLSGLLDRDGHNWLSFKPTPGSGAAGEYRGFPNAVHQQAGNYFHPKNTGTEPAITRVERAGPDGVSISAVSSNGLWACRYDFFPGHCTFTMTRMPDGKRYWVLYEGTPGGQYKDTDWWMTSAIPAPQPMTVNHEGDIPAPEWIAFGDPSLNRTLVLWHHEDDAFPDNFYSMQKKMTVFGFGRQKIDKFLNTAPQRFSIGFVETTNHAAVAQAVAAWGGRQTNNGVVRPPATAPTRPGQSRHAANGASFPGPQAGDVFREYLWTNEKGDAGGSLRVGGQKGYGGKPIALTHQFDLAAATRAEIVIEKLQCHTGTRGLAISVNGNDWIPVPDAPGIPEPQRDYQHHIYPVLPVPLSQLQADGNQFRLRVSESPPVWPQNLIYGVHFRIYYDPARKAHPTGRLVLPEPNSSLGQTAELHVEANSPNGPIRRVDFLGNHEDVNWEGDNVYSQWHYHYVRGCLTNHIGSVTTPPFRLTWDNSWVPDQARPFALSARVTDESGLIYFTTPVSGLTFSRPGFSVELCKPYDVPTLWVTRRGEKSEKIRIAGDPGKAVAAQLVWCSWSPGYMNGLSINEQKVFDAEGPHYAYYAHRVPLRDLGVLKTSENVIKTGATPKRNGQMVHGMEVNWPGIMLLIKYDK